MKLLLGLLFFTYSCLLSGQEEEMYFIVSSSQDLIINSSMRESLPYEDSSKLIIICTLKEDGVLENLDTVNFVKKGNLFAEHIRHFREYGFIYIREVDNYYPAINGTNQVVDFNKYITVIDYSNGDIKIRTSISDSLLNSDCFLFDSEAYVQEGELVYSFSYCSNQKPYLRNVIDKELNVLDLSENIFLANTYSVGSPGFFKRVNAGVPFIDNQLSRAYLRGGNRYSNHFQFPDDEFDNEKYSGIEYLMKSPNINYEVFFKRRYGGVRDSLCTYYLYGKDNLRLDSIKITESIIGMDIYENNFGYGTISLNGKYSNLNSQNNLINRYSLELGRKPDLRLSTGKFYLWDFVNNQFHVGESSELDLEVLLIQDGWIFYRKFDEIRKIQIDEMKAGNLDVDSKLVIKDSERVPNIHHMFSIK